MDSYFVIARCKIGANNYMAGLLASDDIIFECKVLPAIVLQVIIGILIVSTNHGRYVYDLM